MTQAVFLDFAIALVVENAGLMCLVVGGLAASSIVYSDINRPAASTGVSD